MQPDDPRHGTYAGASAHWSTSTPICDPCQQAATRYTKIRRLDRLRGKTRTIPARGTIRRVRALQRIGWPLDTIAAELGWLDRRRLAGLLRQERVTVDVANQVAVIFDALCMTPGPSRRSIGHGIRNGWVPPLGWNDIDKDERPHEVATTMREKFLDEIAIQRVLDGDDKIAHSLSPAERAEVVRRWPGTLNELERLTGWNAHRYTSKDAA